MKIAVFSFYIKSFQASAKAAFAKNSAGLSNLELTAILCHPLLEASPYLGIRSTFYVLFRIFCKLFKLVSLGLLPTAYSVTHVFKIIS